MKVLVNSEKLEKIVRKFSNGEVVKFKVSSLDTDAKKSDIAVLSIQQGETFDVWEILKILESSNPAISVFVLDDKFDLSNHNRASLSPIVAGYGEIDDDITNDELKKLLEGREYRRKVGNNQERYEVGCIVSGINPDEDYSEEKIVKIFMGGMRDFLNSLKLFLDSIRPARFEPDLTKMKRKGKLVTAPLQEWLEMWHAYKQGNTTYKIYDEYYEITEEKIEEARPLFEKIPSSTTQSHILLEGETGVGKSVIANFIHQYYYRGCPDEYKKESPLIVSCTEFNESIGVSSLFGGVEGGWTGSKPKAGFILSAYNGTLFLDEIGDASLVVQSKLLRYLDTKKFRPDSWVIADEIYAPVLVVAATNRNLKQEMANGTFRIDLYNRFTVLRIPPLRECKVFLERYVDFELQNPEINYNPLRNVRYVNFIEQSALDKLKDFDYPGNYRQFRRILKSSILKCNAWKIDTLTAEAVKLAIEEEEI